MQHSLDTRETPELALLTPVEDDCEQRLARLAELQIGSGNWPELSRTDKFGRLSSAIGHTPMESVELSPSLRVLAKQEFANPSGSHYDRAYLATIAWLETNGHIEPGDELRDITSGSAGISLALVARLLDYRARVTIPPELPSNRVQPMQLFGAEVCVSGDGYVPAASIQQTTEIKDLMRCGWKRQKITTQTCGQSCSKTMMNASVTLTIPKIYSARRPLPQSAASL